MQTPRYKHICGYPIQESSEPTHCPGCGGKITPWNTQLAESESGSAPDSGGRALCKVATWLVAAHRDLAIELAGTLETELQGEVAEAMLLRRLYTCLDENLKES